MCLRLKLSTLFLISSLTIYSCQDDNSFDDDTAPTNVSDNISALPQTVIYPANNPYSVEKETLGRLLFWDPILSGNKDVACATCHHPDFGYADGLTLSQGVDGEGLGPNRSNGVLIKRNSPTVINTGFNGINNAGTYNPLEAPMFWDLRVNSLEEQALEPFLSKEEMRGEAIAETAIMDTIVDRLHHIDAYVSLFEAAFGTEEINQDRILKAIATFERGIVATDSRFDQYMRGDLNALSNVEVIGMNRFVNVGCANCHSGPMFSDYELHVIGVPGSNIVTDTGASGDFDFRTPTLRNLGFTAPYMHNGRFDDLEDVVDFYEDISDGRGNVLQQGLSVNDLDEEVRDLTLNGGDINEIVAFLNALNDENFDKTIPESVPSNLSVGGNIE